MGAFAGFQSALIAAAVLWSAAAPSFAQAPDRTLSQYKHNRWTFEDGAPASIAAIAQTPDGFLWLGSGNGLYRFDGIAFQRITPIPGDRARSPQVASLMVSRAGDLWVGYRWGGIAVFREGRLQPVAMPDPEASIVALAEDQAGDIWAVSGRSRNPLSRYRNGQWRRVGEAEGVADQVIASMLSSPDGSIWIAGWDGVRVRLPGQTRFIPVAETADDENKALALDRQGDVWMLGIGGARRLSSNGRPVPFSAPPAPRFDVRVHMPPRVLMDRRGAMWASDQEAGVMRLDRAALEDRRGDGDQVQRLGRAEGLTSDGVTALFEGREGEIWVGTTAGLDRFRQADVVPAPSLSPTGGGLLFTDRRGVLYLIDRTSLSRVGAGDRLERLTNALVNVGAVCDAPDGSLWVASEPGLIHLTGGRTTVSALPYDPELTSYGCIVEPTGRLWLAAGSKGLFRRDGSVWTAVPVGEGDANVQGVRLDPQGRLLVNVRNRGLYRLAGPRTEHIWDGDEIGRITTMGPYNGGILLAGIRGVALLDANGIRVLSSDRYPWLASIRGLTQTATEAWFLTDRGAERVMLADLRRALRNQGPLHHQTFGADDGLPSPVAFGFSRAITSDRSGRIWIMTPDGAVWIDPARLTVNRLPPPVAITALIADGRPSAPGAPVVLAEGTSRIQVEYTAPSLLVPQRVQFRYRLEGADAGWVDAGSRRQAFYTNLRPGVYRFQVIAANDDGVWNRVGATQTFTIPPTFVQSIWFVLLCVAASGLVLYAAYVMRVRYLTERVETRLEARMSERERIARELHDTLLQGVHGLMLRLQAVAERFPVGQTERTLLDGALDRADAVLAEGRDSVHALRSPLEAGGLAKMLEDVAEDLTCDGSPSFRLESAGTSRDIDPLVAEEVGRIGQEAIRNAFMHARASEVVATLGYERRYVVLSVRDNGCGISEKPKPETNYGGHFGLAGLRERATRIGGRLTIDSGPDQGTMVTIAAPARANSIQRGWRRLLQPSRSLTRKATRR
ncbi:MAG: hypothetical protein EON96_00195 [Caulobacteraceae bacterium]|nr:MAG: hypothetical protein EON96_00195 [Caulobacteraceae bacterium]